MSSAAIFVWPNTLSWSLEPKYNADELVLRSHLFWAANFCVSPWVTSEGRFDCCHILRNQSLVDKHCRSGWGSSFWSASSGSTLFANTSVSIVDAWSEKKIWHQVSWQDKKGVKDRQHCTVCTCVKENWCFGRHCFQRVVVVALLFYVHGKHLRSCRDGQLT